jgi:hypothetical protein
VKEELGDQIDDPASQLATRQLYEKRNRCFV